MRVCAVVLLGTLTFACGHADAQVKVWQGSLTLPTYEEGKPDPNPPFDTYATTQFNYPYTLRKSLTGEKKDTAWRAVFLENEYLKCTVLPDIGGHLYTCINKISGQSMFYDNPSIKKAQIGYRGAWAAFGVEFNFPVSHNWVSMSPVDFAFGLKPDGSGSISVGNIDRVYGMQWRVELVLRPGSTLLEERVTLYNRSDVRHRFYWWNNAGIQVWDDSQIQYPMRFAASHGFTEVRRWPTDADGKDLSVIGDQTGGVVSYFVHGSREPFMGIWNPKTQTGTVHYADYSELPAKKIWSWGADAEGKHWRTALSDNESAYVEVQAGLFRNQETYAFLEPGKTIRFSEYWMPVRGTGGISRANKAGVVHFGSRGSDISAALNVNERVVGARLRLLDGEKTLWSETVDLVPEKTWSHTMGAAGKVRLELRDHDGKLLLSHTDGSYDWDPESTIKVGPQELFATPAVGVRTEDDWTKLGADQEANGKVVLALATYRDALAKYPQSLGLQRAAGRLAASLQHYEEAEKLLSEAQKRNTTDAETAYYLGVAEDGLKRPREAVAAYEVAYRQVALRGRAAARIAEVRARQGDLRAAERFLKDAVEAEPLDVRSREQLEAVTRATGDGAEADRLAREGLAMDPTSDFFKEEMGAPDLHHLAADPYRVLRVATEFMELGLYARALPVLERQYPAVSAEESEPGSVLPQVHPLVAYYAAYCKAHMGTDAAREWQAAGKLATDLVFASSAMDRLVLEAAIANDGKDAASHYLLGTLLFSKGLHDEGIAEWMVAKRLQPGMTVLDADLGKAQLQLKGDVAEALVSFRAGIENDATNADNYAGVDEAMSLSGTPAKERAEALGRYPGVSESSAPMSMPANLVYQLALTRAEAGDYAHALALFKGRFFPSEEGGVKAEQVLFEIELMQVEAEAAAGRCEGVGKFIAAPQPGLAVNDAVARAYVREANAAKGCGLTQESERLMKAAAASEVVADRAWTAKAQRALGGYDAAAEQKKLEASLAAAERVKDTSSFTGWWWYNVGTIEAALQHTNDAKAAFRRALLLPDSMMSHHLSRAALVDLSVAW